MASQTLTTRAVIQAVDNLTGPLNTMGGKVRAFSLQAQRHFDGITRPLTTAMSKLGSLPIMGGGFATGLFAGSILHDQIALDKLARQTRAINEIEGPKWAGQMSQMLDLSTRFGIDPQEMLKGAKSWQELGNSVESYIENAQIAAKTSKITGISIAEQMTETSALVRAFGYDPKDIAKFREFERAYLVASKGMKGGAHAYGEAMKNFAPIAKSMGLNIHQASGFVQALGGQFEAGEIGNAFKMGFARLMAPTPKAHAALRAAGLDPLQFWSIDKDKIHGSGHSLAERLRGSGKTVSPEMEARLSRIMANADLSKGGRVVSDQLLEEFTAAYGVGKKKKHLQGEDAKLASQVIAQHLASYRTGLHIEDFFKYMAGQADNVPLIKELFGGHHIAKFQDLFRQGHHVAERIRHNTEFSEQRGGWYLNRGYMGKNRFMRIAQEDVIDRRAKIVLEGLSFQFERMSAAWKSMWSSFGAGGTSGVAGDVAGFYKGAADLLKTIRQSDPGKVRAIAWGLGSMAALPIGVFAAGAIANSVKAVGLLGLGMVRGLAALQLYPLLAARAATGITKVGAATRLAGAAMTGNALMGLGTFVGMLGKVARFTAMGTVLGGAWYALEHWGEVTEAFKNFSGTNAGKGMFASFSALGETAKGLGADLVAVADNLFKILGWKSESPDGAGGAAGTLETLAGWATMLADALNMALTAFRAIVTEADKLPDWMPGWMKDAHKYNVDKSAEQRAEGESRWDATKEFFSKAWNFLWTDTRTPIQRAFGGGQEAQGGDALGVPGSFPPGSFQRYQLADATGPVSTYGFPTAAEINQPIVDAQTTGTSEVGGKVDAANAAIVAAINALAPAMAAALAGAVSRASFGGQAAASAPATGNATGIKR